MIRRFAIKAIVITVAAGIAWWLSRDVLSAMTIAGAKGLHRLIGYPVLKLGAEEHALFWFAPLFPPLVGLTLASTWVPWKSRLIALLIGLAAFWYLVVMQIAVVYTPYLTPTAFRAYLSQSLASLNIVGVPVLLWLSTIGPPPALDGASTSKRPVRARRAALKGIAMALALCLIATLPAVYAVGQSDRTIDRARDRLATSLRADDYAGAMLAMQDMMGRMGQTPALVVTYNECIRLLGDDAKNVRRTSPIEGLARPNP